MLLGFYVLNKKLVTFFAVVLSINAFADNTFIVRNNLRDTATRVANSYRLSPLETTNACIVAVEQVSIEHFPELAGLGESLCSYTHADPGRPAFHRKDIISPIEEILYETSFYIRRLEAQ